MDNRRRKTKFRSPISHRMIHFLTYIHTIMIAKLPTAVLNRSQYWWMKRNLDNRKRKTLFQSPSKISTAQIHSIRWHRIQCIKHIFLHNIPVNDHKPQVSIKETLTFTAGNTFLQPGAESKHIFASQTLTNDWMFHSSTKETITSMSMTTFLQANFRGSLTSPELRNCKQEPSTKESRAYVIEQSSNNHRGSTYHKNYETSSRDTPSKRPKHIKMYRLAWFSSTSYPRYSLFPETSCRKIMLFA